MNAKVLLSAEERKCRREKPNVIDAGAPTEGGADILPTD